MLKIKLQVTILLFALSLAACGSDNKETVLAGTWVGRCQQADTSNTGLTDNVYYDTQLAFTKSTIAVKTSLFADSDCTTSVSIPFEGGQFSEGTYTRGAAFTTESGLKAYPLTVLVNDTGEIINNIFAILNGELFFGFDPFAGPATNQSLKTLELQNAYRKL